MHPKQHHEFFSHTKEKETKNNSKIKFKFSNGMQKEEQLHNLNMFPDFVFPSILLIE